MAIAIKKEGVSRYCTLVEGFSREGRTGIKLTCPEGTCTQGYLVYFDRAVSEDEVRTLFDQRARLQHPFHPDLCAFDEPLPSEKTQMPPLAMDGNVKPAERPSVPLPRALPDATPAMRKPHLPFVMVKALSGAAAVAVTAVLWATKGQRPL